MIPAESGRFGTSMTEALLRGEEFPPVVVVRNNRGRGFGLIDGLNRVHAHWAAGRESMRAYELLSRETSTAGQNDAVSRP